MRRRTQAERKAETRANLLAAARRTFASHGYQATSLDRVSENAGCTRGALYDHFGSKQGLFLALLDDQFAIRIAQAEKGATDAPSEAMPFDRGFTMLFLEFVCAAARDPKLRRRLAARLGALRKKTEEHVGDARLAAAISVVANGAGIEALIFGERQGAAAFDSLVEALAGDSS